MIISQNKRLSIPRPVITITKYHVFPEKNFKEKPCSFRYFSDRSYMPRTYTVQGGFVVFTLSDKQVMGFLCFHALLILSVIYLFVQDAAKTGQVTVLKDTVNHLIQTHKDEIENLNNLALSKKNAIFDLQDKISSPLLKGDKYSEVFGWAVISGFTIGVVLFGAGLYYFTR